MISRIATNMNGITIAYVMAIMNALFAVLVAFGVHLTDTEIAALATLLNASLALAVHIGHRVGEATSSGASQAQSEATFGASTQPAPLEPAPAAAPVAAPVAAPAEPAPTSSPPAATAPPTG
jgi:hypothetical protein